jgi:hypothetical protein
LRFFLLKPILLLTVVLFFSSLVARAQTSNGEAAQLLPNRITTFRAQGRAQPEVGGENAATLVELAVSSAVRTYAANGHTVVVSVFKTRNDASAFSLLTLQRQSDQEVRLGDVGTASIVSSAAVSFSKGSTFVRVLPVSKSATEDELLGLARSLAEPIDAGEKQIPALVKHLPDWEKAGARSSYSVSPTTLKKLLPNQSVLDVLSFEGGAEAVVANYSGGQLLIVESNTPQISSENDRNITAKLQELRNQGLPAPTAYRRVGNYAVFVFDSPSQEAANQLIDQVKYEQLVQWLGRNPFSYEQATREFTETTLGVFVAVVKASGIALVTCFVVGGFLGALLFSLRRAQQRAKEAYSDSDAMLRLNLDELTPESDPGRLLGRGN